MIDSYRYDARMLPMPDATTYAGWFAALSDPTRVRLLHAVASNGPATVGELAALLGVSQSTCSHHLRKLSPFLHERRVGASTQVSVNAGCYAALPHAADVVMGVLATRELAEPPAEVTVRPMTDVDWPAVRQIYADGIATGNATFETSVPSRAALHGKWLPEHRWAAEVGGQVAGWAALTPASARACYSGVAENSLYVGAGFRGRGVGRALLHRQVREADAAGLWTLETAIFPENRASLALHRAAGFRTLGVRERIAQLDGVWRDTVMLERRAG